MKISDFIKNDFFILPKEYKNGDFNIYVSELLDKFIDKLKELKKTHTKFDDIDNSIESILKRQNHLVDKIKESLNYYYDGKPAKAYQSIDNGLYSDLKDFMDVLNIKTHPINTNFYRLRIHKENFPLDFDEFFHIPFHKRGKVKTQRFSITGYPSLYIGTSVYVCWEELNRPNINEFQAVRLINTKEFKVIDLSPPKYDNNSPYDLYKYLMIWPIVCVSSVKVRNIDDSFKPEYIIPQLLLQWVREKGDIDGIAYQTTHINFKESLSEGEFLNLVLPVKEINTVGLCNILKQNFKMTQATSVQLDEFSRGGTTFMYSLHELQQVNNQISKIELIKGRANPYFYSAFNNIERTLKEMPTEEIK